MKINPTKIRLDASTVCQLKCPSCSNALGSIDQSLGSKHLKFVHFKQLLESNPWIRTIELSNWGEIFLNPELLEIAKYAFEKNVMLNAANGVNLNTIREEMLEALVKYRFGVITCSIDGASQETYKIYRKNGDFEVVIANIKKINAYKVKYNSPLPKLRWQYIAFGHNEHEILKAKKMAIKLDMKFHLKLAWGAGFSPIKSKEMIKMFSGLDILNRDEYQKKYGKFYLSESICSQMWIQPQINADGRVLGCSVNYWGDYGNAFKQDLKGILNNEKMNYARAMLLGKKESREDIPCTKCLCYIEMKKNNTWLFSRRQGNEAITG